MVPICKMSKKFTLENSWRKSVSIIAKTKKKIKIDKKMNLVAQIAVVIKRWQPNIRDTKTSTF